MSRNDRSRDVARRRAAACVFATAGMVSMLGMAALAVDVGMLYVARSELQVSADAAALAGSLELLDEDRLKGTAEMMAVFSAARQSAAAYAGMNEVLNSVLEVDLNAGNNPHGDVVLGYLTDPTNLGGQMSFDNPERFNAVRVHVRRNSIRNGPINLLFARIFGIQTADLGAEATAAFIDGVTGFEVTEESGNAELLPLTLHVDSWTNLLNGTVTVGDSYAYDPDTGTVSPGSDGLQELNLYPGAGATQLPPGNFGTVDIGPPNNNTADISRQIRYGVSAADLAYFGGELSLGSDGTLLLNGDTGLSAAIKDDLEFIKGNPRAIPLFIQVSGPGNNAMFTVVAFAGIRIMNVKLTGPMRKKELVIQPAIVVDDAANGSASDSGYFVYEPVRLVR